MLKPLNEAELVTDVPEDVELIEPAVIIPTAFSGIRAVAFNGVAHLTFYVEQPGAYERVENVITVRLAGPLGRTKAAQLSRPALVHPSESAGGHDPKH